MSESRVFDLLVRGGTCVTPAGEARIDVGIENGTITACEGQMVDDGGPDGAAYTDTDYVFTICPDTPGDVIQVEFNAFSLQESANPANSDYLTIFDGDNTGELSLARTPVTSSTACRLPVLWTTPVGVSPSYSPATRAIRQRSQVG